MDAGKDDGSLRQIEGALRSGTWIGQIPALYWIHDFLSPIIGNHLGITVGQTSRLSAVDMGQPMLKGGLCIIFSSLSHRKIRGFKIVQRDRCLC